VTIPVNAQSRPRQSLRFRGRSFLAIVLAPEPPLETWIGELDDWVTRSPGFFAGRPVVLDVSALPIDKAGLADLISELYRRDIRLMGVDGAKASWLGLGMPPPVSGGRQTEVIETAESLAQPASAARGGNGHVAPPQPTAQPAPHPTSLLVDNPVRSGQSVIFPQGDVIVVGSVASGAEIVAGGSIHVYGTLRGRAIAGSMGHADARIFCGKLEAELVAIDGLYRTADEMEAQFRGRRVQAWLSGDALMMQALN
jgi:septum site-determining protein MinC